MKPMNKMNVSFLSCSVNEGFARAVVPAFVAQMDSTIDEIFGAKTAVSEVVINCIVHVYRDTLGMIYITARLYEDGEVQIRIRDKGCDVKDAQKVREPPFTTSREERAGPGFVMMESLMDDILVTSRVQRGTTVTFKEELARRRASND